MSRRPPPHRVFDNALRQERTVLAWDRTGLAMMVAGALFVRAGTPPYHELRHAPGMAGIVFGAALILLAYRRYDWLQGRLHADERLTSPVVIVTTGLFTALFAACALYVVIFGG